MKMPSKKRIVAATGIAVTALIYYSSNWLDWVLIKESLLIGALIVAIFLAILVAVLVTAVVIKVRRDAAIKAARGGAPPPPPSASSSSWLGQARKTPAFVGVLSLLIVLAVVSIQYGGLGWLWISPKLTGSVIVVMIAIAALPAFKPNPGGTAKKAIYLSIGLILFWNLPVLGGGLGLEQVFNPKAEQVGIHAETLRDITVSVTSDPDHPLVVNPDEWSKWVWLGSNYNWGVGSEDDRPFWIMTSSGKPQLHDSKNGKVATFNAGQANRFASGDTKPLKLFFRRKGLAK